MSDLTLSLIVILLAAAATAVIFYFTRRRERARAEELAAYCAEHRYALTVENERTGKELTVKTETWSLVSSMRSSINNSEAGSSEWQKQADWVCERYNSNRPVFALHCSGSSANFDVLPAWVRAAALEKLRREIGGAADALESVRTAFTVRGLTGIAFEPKAMSAQTVLERIEPLIAAWNAKTPIYIESSPERVRIRLPGFFVANADQLDKAIGIGTALE